MIYYAYEMYVVYLPDLDTFYYTCTLLPGWEIFLGYTGKDIRLLLLCCLMRRVICNRVVGLIYSRYVRLSFC